MFNPNEEIQIIGIDLGDNHDMQSQYIAYKGFTELNKKLELKNRYKKQVKENKKLKDKLSKIEPIEIDNGIGFRGSISLSKEEIEKRFYYLEEHLKEFNKLVIKTENELYIKELLKRNNQLQSKWNSLREWLENEESNGSYSISFRDSFRNVLSKMNELESGDEDEK